MYESISIIWPFLAGLVAGQSKQTIHLDLGDCFGSNGNMLSTHNGTLNFKIHSLLPVMSRWSPRPKWILVGLDNESRSWIPSLLLLLFLHHTLTHSHPPNTGPSSEILWLLSKMQTPTAKTIHRAKSKAHSLGLDISLLQRQDRRSCPREEPWWRCLWWCHTLHSGGQRWCYSDWCMVICDWIDSVFLCWTGLSYLLLSWWSNFKNLIYTQRFDHLKSHSFPDYTEWWHTGHWVFFSI